MLPATHWRNKFAAHCAAQEPIRLYHLAEGVRCAGGWDELTGEYDPEADRVYHEAHPYQPVCEYGYVGAEVTVEEVRVFLAPSLTDDQRAELGIGNLEQDEVVGFAPSTVELGDVEKVEYPIGGGRYYRVRNPDVWMHRGVGIFKYAVLQLLTKGEGKGV